MEVKTVDKEIIEIGNSYYLENGESVYLNEILINHDNKVRYLVIPYFEGEGMNVSGDGGYHRPADSAARRAASGDRDGAAWCAVFYVFAVSKPAVSPVVVGTQRCCVRA